MEPDRTIARGTVAGLPLPVSRVVFGTAIRPMLAGEDAGALLDAAFAQGINTFDCARGYGRAEESLGRWVKTRGLRDRVVLLTKCGNVDPQGRVHIDRGVILSELETSLKALDTGVIDLYLLHRDDPQTPLPEIMETLNACKRAGKIRAFGVSNWTRERIEAANACAAARGLEGFAVSSPYFGLARQVRDPWGGGCVSLAGPENGEARAWYAQNRMPVFCYSSLARGFFGGRFRSFDEEGARRVLDGPAQRGYLCAENMRRLRSAEVLAGRLGTTAADIALRYIFGSPMNVFAVVSTTDPRRLAGLAAASLHPLDAEETAFLERDGA